MDLYYINLKKREDRRKEFLAECTRIGYPAWHIYRFQAIEEAHPLGFLGCTKSHLAILKIAKENKLPCVFIAEDDLSFNLNLKSYEVIWNLANRLEKTYEVIMVSSNTIQSLPSLHLGVARVVEAQTASGYIVHFRFYDKLIACLEQAVVDIVRTHSQNFTVDQAWKRLQQESTEWYVCTPKLAFQRPSFSDLALRHVNYGC